MRQVARCYTLSLVVALLLPHPAHAQQVRQIVTFLFQPGRSAEATRIYAEQLKPIYEATTPLRRFRAYREAESPEPLDLIIVSSYDGMSGMDAGNAALRNAPASGPSAFQWYGTLAAMTQWHHDQFVEMIPSLSDSVVADADQLTVFEYYRVAPGMHARFELQLSGLRSGEQRSRPYLWSETGRMLVADGWDYLRVFGVRSLGEWHTYRQRTRQHPMEGTLTARKTIIVREMPALAVR